MDSPIPVKKNMSILFRMRNFDTNLSVKAAYYGIRDNGEPIFTEQTFVPATDGSSSDFLLPLFNGTLYSIGTDTVFTTVFGRAQIGSFLLSGSNQSNSTVLRTFFNDSISTFNKLSWPSSIIRPTSELSGEHRLSSPANPAAGAQFSVVARQNQFARIKSVSFRLVTDATAANRRVFLEIQNGGNTFLVIPTDFNQTASTTFDYDFAPQLAIVNGPNDITAPIPNNLRITETTSLRSRISLLQAGDQISDIRIISEDSFESD